MRGTARWHGLLHIGAHFVAKGALGHMGQIHPISIYVHRENRPIFRHSGFPCSEQHSLGALSATNAPLNADSPKKFRGKTIERFLKRRPHQPMSPHIDVLRQHRLHDLADWAENPGLAPVYAQVSAYWASVLSAPAMRDFAEWPCPARGAQVRVRA